MRRRLILPGIVALACTWGAALLAAEPRSYEPSAAPTLIDRIDAFGRRLFGAGSPSDDRAARQQGSSSQPAARQYSPTGRTSLATSLRSSGTTATGASRLAASGASGHGATSTGSSPSRSTEPYAAGTQMSSPALSASGAPQPATQPQPEPVLAGSASSTMPRLHERLKAFSEPSFPQIAPSQSSAASEVADVSEVARRPVLGRRIGTPMVPAQPIATSHGSPTLAPPRTPEQAPTSREGPGGAATPAGSEPGVEPDVRAAEAKGPGAAGDDSSGAQAAPTAAGDARAGQPASAAATQPRDADTAAQAGPAASEKQTGAAHDAQTEPFSDAKDSSDTAAGAASSAASPNGAGVLIARQSPVLGIETLGPRRITVGKASTYQLTVRNSGQVAAEQVVVTVGLPEWAEVSGTSASQGATVPAPPSGEGGGLLWQVGRLEAAKSENLVLQIVPRQSKPIDLAVKCDYTTAATQAVIEVQEPRLEVRLDGPREVLFGQREMYRLEVTNSGTGDAENVEIALTPLGTGNSTATTHRLGTVKAGDKKTIEVELTARQTGTLTIQVEARSDSGVQARLAEQIAVLRPDVQIEVTAPELQFVGTEATCRICVANSGTAAAKEVTITATIPPQAKFVSCTSGGKLAADHSRVTWMLDTLEVGAEATLGLTCRLAQAGLTRFEAACSAAGGLAASAQAAVEVEAIADLALDVTDPAGPVPVSEEATYQVRVQNRGTKGAEEVEVVAYFSNGIEPVSAEGAKHQTAPGQVTFEKISSLAAGQDLTLRIKAKAEKPGHHVCRVEVYCKTLGTRLVSEETTYFYGKPGTSPPDAASQATGSQPASAPTARTADQRPAASALPASK